MHLPDNSRFDYPCNLKKLFPIIKTDIDNGEFSEKEKT